MAWGVLLINSVTGRVTPMYYSALERERERERAMCVGRCSVCRDLKVMRACQGCKGMPSMWRGLTLYRCDEAVRR